MNILTFDIEDWYNCDFITKDFAWDKYEVRIYQGVERILDELDSRNLKGTFFCLGWLAEKHPQVIRDIHRRGHHIGCHSYQHELSFRFTRSEFKQDTERAKLLIEDVIGERVNAFRAPGFSITKHNLAALDVLAELDFEFDCSLFPAKHDYGGMESYGKAEPARLSLTNGALLKEFPISIYWMAGKNIVFSGGGFFRFFPYFLIDQWAKSSPYMMAYFHPRDFDTEQPVLSSLPAMRKFKSYVGLSGAFKKFKHFLDDYDFVNVEQASRLIDWSKTRIVSLDSPQSSL